MSDVIITLEISAFRRLFGVGVMAALSILMIYAASITLSGSVFGILGLLIFGIIALWGAWRLYSATADGLTLTADGIFTKSGEPLVNLDNVEAVDRGFFAFKPSNGFLLRLRDPMPRGWAPGLWWRFGRRVGVGGATSPGQGKAMADMISVLISEHRNELLDQLNQS